MARSDAPSVARRVEAAGGAVPFEEWMRLALHDAETGYYARHVRGIGARGDFATASTLHPALGQAVAAWASARRRGLGGPLARWHLVEAGPGSGALAEAVLDALPLVARRTVSLHLVETSPVLRREQEARLGGRAAWHDTLEAALAACGGRAVVYASEFLDAFPVRVVRATRGGWEELWISVNQGERGEGPGTGAPGGEEPGISLKGDVWREEWRTAAGDVAAGGAAFSFSALSRPWPEGQRVEIAPTIRSLFLSQNSLVSSSWSFPLGSFSGSLLFLDYGDTIERLYERRPGGTVRGYAHHVRLEGEELYRWAGKADVTADVNFTDVAAWAAEAGFAVAPLETQAAFLARHVPGLAARTASEPAVAFLLDPRGAGAGFKALELRTA